MSKQQHQQPRTPSKYLAACLTGPENAGPESAQYLENNVMEAVALGITAILEQRPEHPIQFLAKFLKQHNAPCGDDVLRTVRSDTSLVLVSPSRKRGKAQLQNTSSASDLGMTASDCLTLSDSGVANATTTPMKGEEDMVPATQRPRGEDTVPWRRCGELSLYGLQGPSIPELEEVCGFLHATERREKLVVFVAEALPTVYVDQNAYSRRNPAATPSVRTTSACRVVQQVCDGVGIELSCIEVVSVREGLTLEPHFFDTALYPAMHRGVDGIDMATTAVLILSYTADTFVLSKVMASVAVCLRGRYQHERNGRMARAFEEAELHPQPRNHRFARMVEHHAKLGERREKRDATRRLSFRGRVVAPEVRAERHHAALQRNARRQEENEKFQRIVGRERLNAVVTMQGLCRRVLKRVRRSMQGEEGRLQAQRSMMEKRPIRHLDALPRLAQFTMHALLEEYPDAFTPEPPFVPQLPTTKFHWQQTLRRIPPQHDGDISSEDEIWEPVALPPRLAPVPPSALQNNPYLMTVECLASCGIDHREFFASLDAEFRSVHSLHRTGYQLLEEMVHLTTFTAFWALRLRGCVDNGTSYGAWRAQRPWRSTLDIFLGRPSWWSECLSPDGPDQSCLEVAAEEEEACEGLQALHQGPKHVFRHRGLALHTPAEGVAPRLVEAGYKLPLLRGDDTMPIAQLMDVANGIVHRPKEASVFPVDAVIVLNASAACLVYVNGVPHCVVDKPNASRNTIVSPVSGSVVGPAVQLITGVVNDVEVATVTPQESPQQHVLSFIGRTSSWGADEHPVGAAGAVSAHEGIAVTSLVDWSTWESRAAERVYQRLLNDDGALHRFPQSGLGVTEGHHEDAEEVVRLFRSKFASMRKTGSSLNLASSIRVEGSRNSSQVNSPNHSQNQSTRTSVTTVVGTLPNRHPTGLDASMTRNDSKAMATGDSSKAQPHHHFGAEPPTGTSSNPRARMAKAHIEDAPGGASGLASPKASQLPMLTKDATACFEDIDPGNHPVHLVRLPLPTVHFENTMCLLDAMRAKLQQTTANLKGDHPALAVVTAPGDRFAYIAAAMVFLYDLRPELRDHFEAEASHVEAEDTARNWSPAPLKDHSVNTAAGATVDATTNGAETAEDLEDTVRSNATRLTTMTPVHAFEASLTTAVRDAVHNEYDDHTVPGMRALFDRHPTLDGADDCFRMVLRRSGAASLRLEPFRAVDAAATAAAAGATTTELRSVIKHAVCAVEQYAVALLWFAYLRDRPAATSGATFAQYVRQMEGIDAFLERLDPWDGGEGGHASPDPHHARYTNATMRWRGKEAAALFR